MMEKIKIIDNFFRKVNKQDNDNEKKEQIFSTINEIFDELESMIQHNYINLIVENYKLFSDIKDFAPKVLNILERLFEKKIFLSKIFSITTQTKFWISFGVDKYKDEFARFLDRLYKLSIENEIPYCRKVASQCLLELVETKGISVKQTPSGFIEIANKDPSHTFFVELSYQINKDFSQIKNYLESRSYYLSPIELYYFSDSFVPKYDTTPNDPYLLHCYLKNDKVNKEQVLSMLNNPLSPFGVSNVICGFQGKYAFDSSCLIRDYDTSELKAMKGALLTSNISSIMNNFGNFYELEPDSNFVQTVFRLASFLDYNDIKQFFLEYYEGTSKFDDYWVNLISSLNEEFKKNILVYISNFRERKSLSFIQLSNTKSTDENTIKNDEVSNFLISKGMFEILSYDIETSSDIETLIKCHIKLLKNNTKLYSATFSFNESTNISLIRAFNIPVIESQFDVTIPVKLKCLNDLSLTLVCTYTDERGSSFFTEVGNIEIKSYKFLIHKTFDLKDPDKTEFTTLVHKSCTYNQFVDKLKNSYIYKDTEIPNEVFSSTLMSLNNSLGYITAKPGNNMVIVHINSDDFGVVNSLDRFVREL